MHTLEPRRQFSRVGLAVFSVTAVTYGLQLVLLPLVMAVWPQFQEHPWFTWLASSLPLYLCGFPCAWLILRPSHKSVTPARPFTLREFGGAFAAGYALLMGGNLLGNLLMNTVASITGNPSDNLVADVVLNTDLPGILIFAVILAPVMEELLFRGLVYDRLAVFGPRWAVVISALLFGLFHGNFYQLFYAVGVGLVLGWLKARTGRLRWGIALHMGINFMGSVIPMALQNLLGEDALDSLENLESLPPEVLAFLAYTVLLVWLAAAGVLVLARNRESIGKALAGPFDPALWKQMVRAPGMILALVLSILVFLLNML